MKTQILNSIFEKKSLNFEKKISKLLPIRVNEIYLSSCGMKWIGRGSYEYFLDFSINGGTVHTIKSFTHDSESYDYWQDLEKGSRKHDNFNKNVCLMLLEENQDFLNEILEDEN
jgi:hypothetical protein